MRFALGRWLLRFVAVAVLAPPVQARRCPPDAVLVGPACVDRYEASVWSIPSDSDELVGKIRRGRATVAQLAAAGAVQMGAIPMSGCTGSDYGPAFPPNGNWTTPLYAASIAGVPPSSCVTWFQAEQACRLAGKRLLTNQEWQAAAAGTPDPGVADDLTTTCATNSEFAAHPPQHRIPLRERTVAVAVPTTALAGTAPPGHYKLFGVRPRARQRRGGDSNPRCRKGTHDFESRPGVETGSLGTTQVKNGEGFRRGD